MVFIAEAPGERIALMKVSFDLMCHLQQWLWQVCAGLHPKKITTSIVSKFQSKEIK